MLITLIVIITLVALTKIFLVGSSLAKYDQTIVNADYFPLLASDEPNRQITIGKVIQCNKTIKNTYGIRTKLAAARDLADGFSDGYECKCSHTPFEQDGIKGLWVSSPQADTSKRLLLIHGGAFAMGSAHGHRRIADEYAHIMGGVVLSVDYSLMPEHQRYTGVKDVQRAYQWLLHNSLDKKEDASCIFVSGDSAGGNLALMLSNWTKTQYIRRPTAVIAMSPSTDSRMQTASLAHNLKTDRLLGPAFTPLLKLPLWLRTWPLFAMQRTSLSNPLVSPIMGDLIDLPPTLIQASNSEILFDDSVRYTNKAREAGSNVTFQVWEGQTHVWQLFNPELGAAKEAFNCIDLFIKRHLPQ